MKVTGKDSMSNFIKFALQLIFVTGVVIIAFLPILLNLYNEYINPTIIIIPTLILLYCSGLTALVIIFKFIQIFNTLKDNTPFIMKNVTNLKTCSVCSLIIAIEYTIGIFFVNSIFSLVVIGVFVIAFLGLYILSELLKQAINYKEENELTI